MKKYAHYRVEDFVLDDYFRDWVLNNHSDAGIFWRKWMRTHPDSRKVVEEAREILLALQPDPPHISHQELEEGLQEVSAFYNQMVVKENARKRLLKKICGILLVTLVTLVLLFPLSGKKTVQWHITREGQQKKVELPDGSSAMLKSDSRLSYSINWRKNHERKVNLRGEAHFTIREEIYHQKPLRFVVITPDLSIEVMGTEFIVNHQKKRTQIYLKSGVIRLTTIRKHHTLKMAPGDMVEYDPSTNTMICLKQKNSLNHNGKISSTIQAKKEFHLLLTVCKLDPIFFPKNRPEIYPDYQ